MEAPPTVPKAAIDLLSGLGQITLASNASICSPNLVLSYLLRLYVIQLQALFLAICYLRCIAPSGVNSVRYVQVLLLDQATRVRWI